jgi:hypothetical protein
MGAVGLTWAQYRMINSMLIDKFGIPILASEVDVRREIKLDTATPIECGEATVEDRHGEERQCTFMRVLDLCDVVEKEVGALFQNDMINKEMDADGSPYAWKIVIKYMGDKGGRSFKFAVSVRVYFRTGSSQISQLESGARGQAGAGGAQPRDARQPGDSGERI